MLTAKEKVTRARNVLGKAPYAYLCSYLAEAQRLGRRKWILKSARGGGPIAEGIAEIILRLRERFPAINQFLKARSSHRRDLSVAISHCATIAPEGPRLQPLRVRHARKASRAPRVIHKAQAGTTLVQCFAQQLKRWVPVISDQRCAEMASELVALIELKPRA